jgi:hypothetical protein
MNTRERSPDWLAPAKEFLFDLFRFNREFKRVELEDGWRFQGDENYSGWDTNYLPTLSIDTGNQSLVLGGTYRFFIGGVGYEHSNEVHVFGDVEGMHVIYFDSTGVLTQIANPNDGQLDVVLRTGVTVAWVYWNAAANQVEYFGSELHSTGMPPLIHAYLHFAFGARWMTGMALNSIVSDGSGNSDASAQFGVDVGSFVDEDLYFTTPAIGATTGLHIYYLLGTSAVPTLRRTTNAGFSVLTAGTGRIAINNVVAGNWTLSEATNGYYVCIHVAAVNENDSTKRMCAFVGQSEYSSVALARTGAETELLNLKGYSILPKEIKWIATLIFQTSGTYSNAVKGRVRSISTGVDWVDWRRQQI